MDFSEANESGHVELMLPGQETRGRLDWPTVSATPKAHVQRRRWRLEGPSWGGRTEDELKIYYGLDVFSW